MRAMVQMLQTVKRSFIEMLRFYKIRLILQVPLRPCEED